MLATGVTLLAVVATERGTAVADRRAELARSAYELIAEEGVGGLSMRTLARRVGATTGLVTHHFADRADVVDAALGHAAEVVVERLRSLPRDVQPLDLLAHVLPTDEVTVENWRFSLAVRVGSLFDPSLTPFDRTIRTIWHDHLPKRLAPLARPGTDPSEATDHVVAAVDGIAVSAVLDPAAWPADRQRHHLGIAFAAALRGDDR